MKDPNTLSFKEWDKRHSHGKRLKKRRLFKTEDYDGVIRYYRCGCTSPASIYIKSFES